MKRRGSTRWTIGAEQRAPSLPRRLFAMAASSSVSGGPDRRGGPGIERPSLLRTGGVALRRGSPWRIRFGEQPTGAALPSCTWRWCSTQVLPGPRWPRLGGGGGAASRSWVSCPKLNSASQRGRPLRSASRTRSTPSTPVPAPASTRADIELRSGIATLSINGARPCSIHPPQQAESYSAGSTEWLSTPGSVPAPGPTAQIPMTKAIAIVSVWLSDSRISRIP